MVGKFSVCQNKFFKNIKFKEKIVRTRESRDKSTKKIDIFNCLIV